MLPAGALHVFQGVGLVDHEVVPGAGVRCTAGLLEELAVVVVGGAFEVGEGGDYHIVGLPVVAGPPEGRLMMIALIGGAVVDKHSQVGSEARELAVFPVSFVQSIILNLNQKY